MIWRWKGEMQKNRAQKAAWFTVNYLPWMVFGGMFIVMLVQALVTLQQYGGTDKENSYE
jgi:hypothetical protein